MLIRRAVNTYLKIIGCKYYVEVKSHGREGKIFTNLSYYKALDIFYEVRERYNWDSIEVVQERKGKFKTVMSIKF